jgi:acyl-CoA synthetase (AMP-forming)/AMP-acid ligase II
MAQPPAANRVVVAAEVTLAKLLDSATAQVPDRVAIAVADGDSRTYAELAGVVDRCAAALRAVGARPGDRVAVLDSAGLLSTTAVVAAARIGAVATMMNVHLTANELRELAHVAGCSAVGIAGDGYEHALTDAIRGTAVGMRDIDAADVTDPALPIAAGDDDDAVVLFTSGTTGLPKAVAISSRALQQRIEALTLPLDPSAPPTVRMICVPIFHVGGLLGLLRNLRSGVTTVIQPRFDAGQWLRLVDQHRVGGAFLVPTMLRRILDHADLPAADLSSLTAITYGAAPAPADLIERAIAALPWVAFSNTFGQTETLGGITALTADDHRNPARIGSVGRPLDGVVIRIVDDGGDDVGNGDVGELWVLSPQNVAPGWVRTGDLVRRDGDGYLYAAGRVRDLINRGGEKISPEEVEAALRSHPRIVDVAVAGVADEDMGERVGAVVVASAPITLDELRAHCRDSLARYKLPELMTEVAEIPVNALGKVVRPRVRELLATAREQAGAR